MASLIKGQNIKTCSKCLTQKNCIFSHLDDSQLRELEKILNSSFYPSGAIVFSKGDKAEVAYLICAGQVKLSTFSLDGRSATVAIANAGDVIGVDALLSGEPHNVIAEALEMTQVCFIRKDDFISFLRRFPSVSFRVNEKLSNRLYDTYRALNRASFNQSYERLVEFLLRFSRDHGELMSEGIRLNIRMSQEKIADEIGSSRRSVTRALSKLKKQKIISYQRHHITIHDRAALENCLSFENLF